MSDFLQENVPDVDNPGHPDDDLIVHLGISMAGAVSGGAYTAGVMDYLFDNLKSWHERKKTNYEIIRKYRGKPWSEVYKDNKYESAVPMHRVTIEVMGGASAGAMATVLSALSMYRDYDNIAESETRHGANTMLSDAWVNMAERLKNDSSTFHQMLTGADIKKHGHIRSLLNPAPLQKVKERILERLEKTAKRATKSNNDQGENSSSKSLPGEFHPYDKTLDVVLTITSLRPAIVEFHLSRNAASGTGHVMKINRGLAKFALDPTYNPAGTGEVSNPIKLNPSRPLHIAELFDVAIASGAFPVGLAPKEIISLKTGYVRSQLDAMYRLNQNDNNANALEEYIEWKLPSSDYFNLAAVDGGVMNNDPFGEVNRILSDRVKELCKESSSEEHNHVHLVGNIFIDPFPNFHKPCSEEKYNPPGNILSTVSQLIVAMLNQVRFKDSATLESFVDSTNFGIVFPSYRGEGISPGHSIARHPLASGAFQGFIGMVSRQLRYFDYTLGKRNCRSFIRNYFYLEGSFQDNMKAVDKSRESNTSKHRPSSDTGSSDQSNDSSAVFARQEKLYEQYLKRQLDVQNFLSNSIESNTPANRHKKKIPIIPDIKTIFSKDQSEEQREDVNADNWYISSSLLKKSRWPIFRRLFHLSKSLLRDAGTVIGSFYGQFIPFVLIITISIAIIELTSLKVFAWSAMIFVVLLLATLFFALYGLSGLVFRAIEKEVADYGQLTNNTVINKDAT